MSLVLLAGCDVQPSYAPVAVSAADLRNALPEIKQRGQSMVTDDQGTPHEINGSTQVEYRPEPPDHGVITNIGIIEGQCLPFTIPHPHCELDLHRRPPFVYAQNGNTYNPRWDSIAAVTLGLGVLGGIVGLEAYCFENCGTGGKIALVSVDVVSVVVGAIVVVVFAGAVARGMN